MINLYFIVQFFGTFSDDNDNKNSEQESKLEILREISRIMDEEELSEVFYKSEDITLRVKRGIVVEPSELPQQAKPQKAVEKEEEAEFEIIRAPRPGTFYRAPAPDEPPFVEVGVKVPKDDILCIIEAMKFYNKIHADFSCEIVEIIAEDAKPVQYDDPLFKVKRLD